LQWWIIWYNTEVSTGKNTGDTYKIISGTQAQAEAQAKLALSGSVAGPYTSQAAALTAAKAGKGSVQQNSNPLSGGASTTGAQNWYAGISNFFQGLTDANTWIRVGQVAVGLVLVAVGLARITHAVPAATKVAKTLGAVAI